MSYSIQLKNSEIITIPSGIFATGDSTHNAVTVTDTSSINLSLSGQDISGNVLSSGVNHQDLNGILGSTSYYHVSSAVYAVLTTGLSSSFSSGDYVSYSNATSTVALGNYGISGSTATFSSEISANNASLTSGLTATTSNFSSGIRVLGAATITATLTCSSGATIAEGLDISSSLSVTGSASFSTAVTMSEGLDVSSSLTVTGASTFSSGLYATNNLGIGTTSTTYKLYVYGSDPQLIIEDSTNNCQARMLATDTEVYFGTRSNHPVRFTMNNSTKMILSTNDYIGIGDNSPTSQLHMSSSTFRIATARTIANSSDAGNVGEICWSTGFIYVRVSTGAWARSALSTW